MIPKLDNAIEALGRGVKKVKIGSSDAIKELINGTAGTTIVDDK
jgi:carbamate kinase